MLCYIVDLSLVVFQMEKTGAPPLKKVDLMKFDVVDVFDVVLMQFSIVVLM